MEKNESPKSAEIQIARLIDHGRPAAVLSFAKSLFHQSFIASAFSNVEKGFRQTLRLFEGRFPGFRRCNTEYHDQAHSLQVFSSSMRLVDGCILEGLLIDSRETAELLIAALLHDAGYIQSESDTAGTGAKYTRIHVERSAAFVRSQGESFGLDAERLERVARIITGTDLAVEFDAIPWQDDQERLSGAILASADLLGQMSDRAYLEKLLFLYHEFREAGIDGYASAFDILRKTASFYASTERRLDEALGRVSRRGRAHFAKRLGVDRDLFRDAIARNMAYLDSIIADDSTNFRKKLKRLDLEAVELSMPRSAGA